MMERARVPTDAHDPNLAAYERMEAELRRRYDGQYVAFVDGAFAGAASDRDVLLRAVYDARGPAEVFVRAVGAAREPVRFRSPYPG